MLRLEWTKTKFYAEIQAMQQILCPERNETAIPMMLCLFCHRDKNNQDFKKKKWPRNMLGVKLKREDRHEDC